MNRVEEFLRGMQSPLLYAQVAQEDAVANGAHSLTSGFLRSGRRAIVPDTPRGWQVA